MTHYEAKKYYAYARECLRQAETAEKADAREKLIELSRVWMEAALNEGLSTSALDRSSYAAHRRLGAVDSRRPTAAPPSPIRPRSAEIPAGPCTAARTRAGRARNRD
jgi:hypothetical protein